MGKFGKWTGNRAGPVSWVVGFNGPRGNEVGDFIRENRLLETAWGRRSLGTRPSRPSISVARTISTLSWAATRTIENFDDFRVLFPVRSLDGCCWDNFQHLHSAHQGWASCPYRLGLRRVLFLFHVGLSMKTGKYGAAQVFVMDNRIQKVERE